MKSGCRRPVLPRLDRSGLFTRYFRESPYLKSACMRCPADARVVVEAAIGAAPGCLAPFLRGRDLPGAEKGLFSFSIRDTAPVRSRAACPAVDSRPAGETPVRSVGVR